MKAALNTRLQYLVKCYVLGMLHSINRQQRIQFLMKKLAELLFGNCNSSKTIYIVAEKFTVMYRSTKWSFHAIKNGVVYTWCIAV